MRVISPELQSILDLPSCKCFTTFDIILASGPEYHFSTAAFRAQGFDYTDDLRISQEIRTNLFTDIDRVSLSVQNVDLALSSVISAESFTNSVGIIGRFYRTEDPLQSAWTELFRGQAMVTGIDENAVSFEVINDLAAAGFIVANWSLVESCQFVFKDPNTCAYAGSEAKCNKQRRSPDGCQGRNNEHHFGGMEQPENPVPTPATSRLSVNYLEPGTDWSGRQTRQVGYEPIY